MSPILIVYATREGHTRRIAEHIAELLLARGLEVELLDARSNDAVGLAASDHYSGAILAASLHMGRHEPEMVRFIEREHRALTQLPTAFLSISMSAAAAQNEANPPEYRRKVRKELDKISEMLFEKTNWHPARKTLVAGALMYTKYNVLVRWVMKRIARHEGGSTDTTRDHVYTDWNTLDHFIEAFVSTLEDKAAPSEQHAPANVASTRGRAAS